MQGRGAATYAMYEEPRIQDLTMKTKLNDAL